MKSICHNHSLLFQINTLHGVLEYEFDFILRTTGPTSVFLFRFGKLLFSITALTARVAPPMCESRTNLVIQLSDKALAQELARIHNAELEFANMGVPTAELE